jgi:hypothetical protein
MPARRRSLKELAGDPRFIPGVYNYCDRWCERCPLTSRCLVYATEQQEEAVDPAARDIRNRAFWEGLEGIFRETHEMLDEMLRESGIELTPLDAETERALRRWQDEARNHPCAVAASEYGRAVEDWFKQAEPCFQARAEALASQHRIGLPAADPESDTRRLQEATDVLRWYQHQIAVKLMRAAGSSRREDELDLEFDRSDADGSAKVALIGIDRSLGAWSEVLRQLPEEEDRLLPLLAALSRLRRDVETAFPNARAFARPGFDTGDAAPR